MSIFRVFATMRRLVPLVLVILSSVANAMTVSVSVNPDRVRPNEGLVAAFTVTNNGAATVSDIVLQGRVPATGVNSF